MKFLRWKELKEKVGLARVSIWRMEKEGKFPRRRHLMGDGNRSQVGWIEEEVDEWMSSRDPVGVDDD